MSDLLRRKECQQALEKGLSALGLPCSPLQLQQLLDYLALLYKWNQRMNLTAIREPLKMVSHHLLDSLTILEYLHGTRILDVGTGAGLPGIPLSIFRPEQQFTLLDSSQKKQIFVSQVVKLLSLKNVNCVHSLVEQYQVEEKFSTILCRAFAPAPAMVQLCAHLLATNGCILVMMGKIPQEQLLLPTPYHVARIVSLRLPGEDDQRHVAIITKG